MNHVDHLTIGEDGDVIGDVSDTVIIMLAIGLVSCGAGEMECCVHKSVSV